MKKAIVYLNQFFGQIGGEDKADFKPEIKDGVIGPSIQLQKLLDDTEITHTIICGDNFIGSNTDEAIDRIIDFLKDKDFDIFIAGPAFQAGRYGVACGHICKAVKEKLNKPVVTSMHEENPGVDMFKKEMYISKGGNSAGKMKQDLSNIAKIANKILKNEQILDSEAEGYFPRGKRHQVWFENGKIAADRAVDMIIKKLNGEKYETELPIPKIDKVPIASAIKDITKANIALVNTGGIVPVNNPDRIQSASATRWGRYDISNINDLKSGVYKTIHAGFDPAVADDDPDVITPIDALKLYEKEGYIGKLHEYFYSTVGTGTTQAEASKMANEMIPYLKESNVDAIIMVST
ncbi:glycine reductase complex component B subunit gamma [[Clostridium] sordellii]|nr:glycine reductase complex component B subunit gamma [[Clostridium] sordellii] [Paeniclostridium sordellii]CEP39412.1 glycine reductase complex component B subunit gamma [[Clostridium] sordellii] [Paeniclostridium sordellii]CEP46586.1 glycine reductase complex component B subunit gamma [[Clostridium] sordellii] [Paeniclostridium sordellii]CEP88271.1 glycine reductase complex component B subunit gamma [[Clostridium] sordellii] [Paeniclostridium sordellii]